MKRGYLKTNAVILNSMDYGESDRIVTFFTQDFGKFRCIAKGARKSKRRFVGNLEAASLVDAMCFKTGESDLLRVDSIELIEGFWGSRGVLERYAAICYMLELTNEFTPDGVMNRPLFSALVGFLRLVDSGADKDSLLRFFEIKLLGLLGYLPYLEGCVACKRDVTGERVFFSSEKGGLICQNCVPSLKDIIPLTQGTARLLSTAGRLELSKLLRLVTSRIFLKESEAVMADFIRYQLGKELKTKKLMEQLRRA